MFVLNKIYFYVGLYLFYTFFILSVTNTSLDPKPDGNTTRSTPRFYPRSTPRFYPRRQVGRGVRVQNFTRDRNRTISRFDNPLRPKMSIPLFVKPVNFARLDLRIGKVLNATAHPTASALYIHIIDIGERKPRQVTYLKSHFDRSNQITQYGSTDDFYLWVCGLGKYIPLEEMINRMVVLLCNIRPMKIRGVFSHAMIMCAKTLQKIETLIPPPRAVPGDIVNVNGYTRAPDRIVKFFQTISKDLRTNELMVATYKDLPLRVSGKGFITTATLTFAKIN